MEAIRIVCRVILYGTVIGLALASLGEPDPSQAWHMRWLGVALLAAALVSEILDHTAQQKDK